MGQFALNCVFVAMALSVLIMLGPALLGFHRYVILTGSMTGTYDRGSIVFDRPAPVSSLKVGDAITYSPPPGFSSQKRITHRIWWIGRGPDAQRIFRTKGDANKKPDAWKFTLDQSTQDRVIFAIPAVGYVFSLLSLRAFRIVLIGLPALIIGLMMMRALWREGGEESRRQKLAELGWMQASDSRGDTILAPLGAARIDPRPVSLELHLHAAHEHPGHPRLVKRVREHPPATLRVARLLSPHAILEQTRNRVGQRTALNDGTMPKLCVAHLRARPTSPERTGPRPLAPSGDAAPHR